MGLCWRHFGRLMSALATWICFTAGRQEVTQSRRRGARRRARLLPDDACCAQDTQGQKRQRAEGSEARITPFSNDNKNDVRQRPPEPKTRTRARQAEWSKGALLPFRKVREGSRGFETLQKGSRQHLGRHPRKSVWGPCSDSSTASCQADASRGKRKDTAQQTGAAEPCSDVAFQTSGF